MPRSGERHNVVVKSSGVFGQKLTAWQVLMGPRSTWGYLGKLGVAGCIEDCLWLSKTDLLAVNKMLCNSARADRAKRQWHTAHSLPLELLCCTITGESLVLHHGLLLSCYGYGGIGSHEWDRVISIM